MSRILTDEQIKEAKELRRKHGYSKRQLAVIFKVPPTVIWENVFRTKKKVKNIKALLENIRRTCIPCRVCEICLTKVAIDSRTIPLNYQIGDICVTCYMREKGINFMDLYELD